MRIAAALLLQLVGNALLLLQLASSHGCHALSTTTKPRAITGAWPQAFPAKDLCSNCGLCKTDVGIASVTEACAFIGDGMARAEGLEEKVHGRARDYDSNNLDEAYFGVHEEIVLARGNVDGAQWTGVATGIAIAWLEAGEVDTVVVAGSSSDGFGEPEPVLCRTVDEVLRGKRVKPSLCPSLAILDVVRDDPSIKRLLFCGVGCAVQALRAINGGDPEQALNLDDLYILGTHCVDNSPTPQAARNFVSTLPGVGAERADDVLAYEFMADFRVHTRLRGGETVKSAYMSLPPSIGVPSIARSCFSCFDYTNGLADVVVGYMGAPFDAKTDEMTTAPLMVTVRNAKGRRMLANAVERGSVEILERGGPGGRRLPSTGDRRSITVKTVEGDSMVKTLLDPEYVAGDKGAPPFIANILADVIAKALPTGLEFARYSIDYHYLRNRLFCDDRMGNRAARHVPAYARAICEPYADDIEELKNPAPPKPGPLWYLAFGARWQR